MLNGRCNRCQRLKASCPTSTEVAANNVVAEKQPRIAPVRQAALTSQKAGPSCEQAAGSVKWEFAKGCGAPPAPAGRVLSRSDCCHGNPRRVPKPSRDGTPPAKPRAPHATTRRAATVDSIRKVEKAKIRACACSTRGTRPSPRAGALPPAPPAPPAPAGHAGTRRGRPKVQVVV